MVSERSANNYSLQILPFRSSDAPTNERMGDCVHLFDTKCRCSEIKSRRYVRKCKSLIGYFKVSKRDILYVLQISKECASRRVKIVATANGQISIDTNDEQPSRPTCISVTPIGIFGSTSTIEIYYVARST